MTEPTTKEEKRAALQHMLGNKLNELDGDFKQWWSVARQSEEPPSAHDFLVHLGLNQELVQKLLWEAMAEYCPRHPKVYSYDDEEEEECERRRLSFVPGSIDYYSRRLFWSEGEFAQPYCSKNEIIAPKPFYSFPHMLEAALMEGATRPFYGPSEKDIKSLAKLTTTALACQDWYKLAQVAAQQFMRLKTYTAKFVKDLMEILPCDYTFESDEVLGKLNSVSNMRAFENPNRNSPIRYCMDHECMLVIQRILDGGVESLSLTENFWTERSFKECLNLFTQTRYLEEVMLTIPESFVDDDRTPPPLDSDFSPEMKLSSVDGPCGIETLELCLGHGSNNAQTANPFPGVLLSLQSIFSMPDLRHLILNLSTFPLQKAAPCLLRTIRETSLSLLQIKVRAVSAHGSNNNSLVMDMLAALKNNTSLKRFRYYDRLPLDLKPFQTQLLEVLQEHNNTTLFEVILFREPIDLGEKINYILGLNKHGRALAQDPSTEVKDFVANLSEALEFILPKEPKDALDVHIRTCGHHLFGSASEIRREEERKRLEAFNISYGLLRELPGSWSNHLVCRPVACPPSKRRKLL